MTDVFGIMKDANGNALHDSYFKSKIDTLESQVDSIESAVSGTASVEVVSDITARNALSTATKVLKGTLCWVTDASADSTVTAGAACYIASEEMAVGSSDKWVKVAEVESLDVDNGTVVENGASKPSGLTAAGFYFEKDAE